MASNATANRVARWVQDNRFAAVALAATVTVASAAGLYFLTSSASVTRASAPDSSAASSSGKSSSSAAKKKRAKKAKKSSKSSTEGPILDDAGDEHLARLSEAELARLPQERKESVAQYLKGLGNKAYSDKKHEEAIQHYTKALSLMPSAVFYSNRAACYANLGQPDKVINDCNEALKLEPTYIKALNRRAVATEQLGEKSAANGAEGDRARERLEQSLSDFTAVAILGQFRDVNATASVERVLRKLASGKAKMILSKREPRLPSPTFVKAYLDAFRPKPAPSIGDDAPQGDQTLKRAFEALEAQDYAHSLSFFQEALQQGLSTKELEAAALNMHGTYMFVMGEAKRALEDLDRSIELCPENVQTWVKKASVHVELGDKDAAMADFDRAVALNADDPDIYYHRGQVHFILGEFEAAMSDYSKSSSSAAKKKRAKKAKKSSKSSTEGPILDDAGDEHLARLSEAELARLPQERKESVAQYLKGLGNKAYSDKKHEEAIQHYTKALSLMPSAVFYSNRAACYANLGQPDKVINDCNEALKLEPTYIKALNRRAVATEQLGEKSAANGAEGDRARERLEQLCRDALRIDPDCDVAIATLAQLSLQQSKIPEAIEYFRKSADIARTEPELVNAITYEYASRAQLQFIRDYPEQGAALSQIASSLM